MKGHEVEVCLENSISEQNDQGEEQSGMESERQQRPDGRDLWSFIRNVDFIF